MQLDLFQHAPRFYHQALERLGALDLAGCRVALARHRQECPQGPDPDSVEAAALWLESGLPPESSEPESFVAAAMLLCRQLREGDHAPASLALGTAAGRWVVASLARRALAGRRPGSTAAGSGLPWGLFEVLLARHAAARGSLIAYLQQKGPSSAAYLALAEAADGLDRHHEAECAAREGCGLDPDGSAWGPPLPWLAALRRRYRDDPEYAGPWWLVGAYLDERLPRYEAAPPALFEARLGRFLRPAEGALQPAPARFFAGLFFSEHGARLPLEVLSKVRRTLRELHPEAYARHLELVDQRGPPPRFLDRIYIGW